MLSPREKQIVVLVGKHGMSWTNIATGLKLHRSTIRTHVNRIITKFQIDRKPREALTMIYWKYVAPGDDDSQDD